LTYVVVGRGGLAEIRKTFQDFASVSAGVAVAVAVAVAVGAAQGYVLLRQV